MVSMAGAGEGNLKPPAKLPSFDFFHFVSSQQNVTSVLTAFYKFPGGLAPLSLFHKYQLKSKIMYKAIMSGNCLEETEIPSVTDTDIHKRGSVCHFPEHG